MQEKLERLDAQRRQALSKYYAGKKMSEEADREVERVQLQMQAIQETLKACAPKPQKESDDATE